MKKYHVGWQRLKMNLKTGQFVHQEGGEEWNHVFLDNGKKFRVQNVAGECPDVVLKGKEGYKQLPDGCRILIGSSCIAPIPANCRRAKGIYCKDKKVHQDYRLFQWEVDNQGWTRVSREKPVDILGL